MKTLTLVYLVVLILTVTACGKDKTNSTTPAQPQALPAWSQADQDTYMSGCITSAHASQPTYSFTAVQTYCQCTLTAAMGKYSATDFANNPSDQQALASDGVTIPSCKKAAGL